MEFYNVKRNDTIDLNELVFLEAKENYTLFHFKDGSSTISSSTLKRHQEKLVNESFLRVNRAIMINTLYINTIIYKKDTPYVALESGQEIRVSRRRRDVLPSKAPIAS
jgi:two-component system, LytTR family, response regulator